MKNIIIFSEPRCGKTTLANMIVDRFHYQVIRIDTLRDTFEAVFPELNIAPNTAIKNDRFQMFIQEYLNRCSETHGRSQYGYILEGCETSVHDCNKFFNNDNNIIYYLVSTNISPVEFLKNIRQHDSKDEWTHQLNNDELLECTKDMIKKGKQIQEECRRYNIPCFDTSHDRQAILESILAQIEQRL